MTFILDELQSLNPQLHEGIFPHNITPVDWLSKVQVRIFRIPSGKW